MSERRCCASLLCVALLAACATPPAPREATIALSTLYAFVVLSGEGRADRAGHHLRRDLPERRAGRRRALDDGARAAGNDAVAPDVQHAREFEAVRVSGADLRDAGSAGRGASDDRRSRAAAAEDAADQDRGHRRLGLPDQDRRQRVPGVRRSRAMAVRDRCEHCGRQRARSRHPCRRLSLSRERMPRRQRRLRGHAVGLRVGCLGGGFLRTGREIAGRRAVDRRARQSRILRARRAGLVALSRPAAARGTPGLQRSSRRSDRRFQRAVRRPVGSRCAVHRLRFLACRDRAAGAGERDARDLPCAIRARVRARRTPPEHVLHEPSSCARVRAQPRKTGGAVSGKCAACSPCSGRSSRWRCSRPTSRR